MTAERIAKMVSAGESEALEFKTTTGTRREATRTVCAMLNQQGGNVLFGVSPEGHITGQQVNDRTLEQLSAEFQRIDPPAFPVIERLQVLEDREVVVISVKPGQAAPYMYRGTAYRRVGNTTLEMRSDEYNRMLFERIHGEQRWENQAAEGWSVDDLDGNEIRTTVEEAIRRGRLEDPGTRDTTDLLRGLGLFRDGTLWRAAVVLFGNEEQIRFAMPQCLLRVARFKGMDRTEFLDNRQFHGNAFSLLRAAERFLRDSLPIASRIEDDSLERIDEPLFPPSATREALVNAFCHRDYSIGGGSVGLAIYDDRLEITSSGALHFGLTPEKLFAPHESVPWNPLIADTFFRRGIIERWGRGTLKMAELTTAAGQPHPEIEDAEGHVTVRFLRDMALDRPTPPVQMTIIGESAEREPNLNEVHRMILNVLRHADHPLALREIHSLLPESASIRQVKRALTRLKEHGLAASTGRGGSARWNAPSE